MVVSIDEVGLKADHQEVLVRFDLGLLDLLPDVVWNRNRDSVVKQSIDGHQSNWLEESNSHVELVHVQSCFEVRFDRGKVHPNLVCFCVERKVIS
jgi:hypothetical protein